MNHVKGHLMDVSMRDEQKNVGIPMQNTFLSPKPNQTKPKPNAFVSAFNVIKR